MYKMIRKRLVALCTGTALAVASPAGIDGCIQEATTLLQGVNTAIESEMTEGLGSEVSEVEPIEEEGLNGFQGSGSFAFATSSNGTASAGAGSWTGNPYGGSGW